jgi:hypothetical protein
MRRRVLGVSGTVSALLTVLLLVAGFAVSTGLLSAIYSAQSEVLRRAVNVGEAVSERLQAFVYQDVGTNRTLLTVRNVGSVGSEVEYLMAVAYDGNVLAEVRPRDTIKLGTQQAFTLFLSDLLGPGFDNYTEVRSRMAVLYLKTVKGGVFGSGYMAPPSVMTAAYATSTSTFQTTETNTQYLGAGPGETTVFTWTATVVENPRNWPVEAYVGIAFPRDFGHIDNQLRGLGLNWTYMAGFPSWGYEPGLKAIDQNGFYRDVGVGDIYIPKNVVCGVTKNDFKIGWGPHFTEEDSDSAIQFSYLNVPYVPGVFKFSRLGPTYYRISEDPCKEVFEPRMNMPRFEIEVVVFGGSTSILTTYITTVTSTWTESYMLPPTITTRTYTTTITGTTRTTYRTTNNWWVGTHIAITTYTTTATITQTFTTTPVIATTHTTTKTRTTEVGYAYGSRTTFTQVGDIRDNQYATFPPYVQQWVRWPTAGGTAVSKHIYRLAYIKAVNLWNTTEVVAYVKGSETNTIRFKADRPIGLAAVYAYHSSYTYIPPPPPPPEPGPCYRYDVVYTCPTGPGLRASFSGTYRIGRCEHVGSGPMTVTVNCPNCSGVWVAPAPGEYGEDQVTSCQKNGSTFTCNNVPPGSTIIYGNPT